MINIKVSYKLIEHLKLSRETMRSEVSKNTSYLKWYHEVAVQVFAATVILPVFFIKKLRVGSCTFEIDKDSIQRNSSVGVNRVEWADVNAVQVFSQVYVMKTKKGSVPIPFRCFEQNERELFEEYASAKLYFVKAAAL